MKLLLAVLIVASLAGLSAQAPATVAPDQRAIAAMWALDRYLETWNSRDARHWASSLHFPHIRPGPGAFELSANPEEYIKGVDFGRTLATGWHHSEWVSRQVLQVADTKVHIAGAWQRYTSDDKPLTGSLITYVITRQAVRWGVLARFAAGPSGVDAATSTANTAAARTAVAAYFTAWNSHDHNALAEAIHYPHVRIDGGGGVEVWRSASEFLAGSEPARQRTWFETRLDAAQVIQVSADGVNVAFRFSRRDRNGTVLSAAEAIALIVRRDQVWRVQALSTMGA